MVRGTDPSDRRTYREHEPGDESTRPKPELRWVQLQNPKHAIKIGRNGRVLASHYHEGYDAWEVLLETYEGELE